MEIIESLTVPEQPPCSLALGAFDGLHRGHMAVVNAALEAPGGALEPAVFTFRRSPSGEPLVATAGDKARLLKQAGVRRLYSLEFERVRLLGAESFVKNILFRRLNARRLCCGEDFRFGRGAAGDAALLERLCREEGASLAVLPPVTEGGEKISSTRIRRAVESGDAALARRLLGRPFGFTLEVIHGNHIGSTMLGTPTINQALPEDLVLPRFGVYAAWCRFDGRQYYGVCNVGVKPTVGSDRVLAETWMPDFSGDLYGRQVKVELLEFIRPERKFSSLDELKEEIRRNGAAARKITEKQTAAG